MASYRIEVNSKPTGKAEIPNAFPSEKRIQPDVVMGMADKVESVVGTLQEQEYDFKKRKKISEC